MWPPTEGGGGVPVICPQPWNFLERKSIIDERKLNISNINIPIIKTAFESESSSQDILERSIKIV
jgi:hypothetical protein